MDVRKECLSNIPVQTDVSVKTIQLIDAFNSKIVKKFIDVENFLWLFLL